MILRKLAPAVGLLAVTIVFIGCPSSESIDLASDAPTAPDGTAAVAETPAGGAATPTAAAPEGTSYGEGVTVAETTSIVDLVEDIDAWEGKTVRVEGTVTGVCAKRGCWMDVGAEEGYEKVKFKVNDGVIVIPMSAKGKWAVAEGVVRKQAMDLEQTRSYFAHLAEESGEEFDPESVTEPVSLVRLDGTGAVIRDAK